MHPQAVYDLRVTIIHARPKIWRRLVVPADISLSGLHTVIQIATGAPDSGQHFFKDSQKTIYADPAWDDLPKIKPSCDVKLERLMSRPGDRMAYFCGSDDEWEHAVELLEITDADGRVSGAHCLGGSQQNRGDGECRSRNFSLSAVNRALRRLKV